MVNHFLHKTILLRDLIVMLRDEGISVNAATAIEMQKALERMDYSYDRGSLVNLKYYLTPIISRNKEEQESIHRIFDKLDEKSLNGYVDDHIYKRMPQQPDPSGHAVESPQPPPSQSWRKFVLIILPVIALAAVLSIFRDSIFTRVATPKLSAIIIDTAVINEPVNFSISLPGGNKEAYSVDWEFSDTLIKGAFSVQRIFTKTGSQQVTALLKDDTGKQLDSVVSFFTVLCEKTPSLSIQKISGDEAAGEQVIKKTAYAALITNASDDSTKYRYQWYADDRLVSEMRVLQNIKRFNTLKVVVHYDSTVHCSADSLTASMNALPSVTASVTRQGNYSPPPVEYEWNNIFYSLLLLILLPLIPAYLVFKLASSFFTPKEKKAQKVKPTEGPYKIEFTGHDDAIASEEETDRLSDLLRKRQVSEIQKLSIRKTISATVAMGGIPMLQYVPLTRPASYLVFIDKEYPDSHLVKLFEWLVAKLQKEQVDVTVYEYYKEPLYLSNEKLNQLRLPVERVASLYSGSTLFIFGDARQFVYPRKGVLKSWVTAKFSMWDTKMLITPFAKNDWDKKELEITAAGFIVTPADLSASIVIEDVVNRHIESHAQQKHPVPFAYPARFLNFQEFEALKKYLDNDALLQWVCSLAVYTSLDWNLTLAMGSAIEKDLHTKGKAIELVNYTNLLKIGRIAWMQNGMLPDSLRVQMLEHLNSDAELLARQTLVEQLDMVTKATPITDASLIKREIDVHDRMNKFLIKSYAGEKISKEEKTFVHGIIKSGNIDEAQEIYLNSGSGSLLRHPFRKKREVGLDRYFKLNDLRNKRMPVAIGALCFVLLVFLSGFIIDKNTGFFTWTGQGTRDITFRIKTPPGILPDIYAEIRAGGYTKGFTLANEDTVVTMKGVAIRDTSMLANVTITGNGTEKLADVFFKLNTNDFAIDVFRAEPRPLTIYYNSSTALALANTIEQGLPENYNVTKQQRSFADTAIRIYYFNDSLEPYAQSLAAIASSASQSTVTHQHGDTIESAPYNAGLAMFVTASKECRAVAMPASLNEIWVGGTSRRFININLPQQLIYYSGDNAATFTKFRINSVCLSGSGVYKVIASDNSKRYKLFFFRNLKPQSFELSVCEGFAASMTELQDKDESYCDRFNSMRWSYANDRSRIYLPVNGGSLLPGEKQKLDRKSDSLQKISSISKHSIQLFSNEYISVVSENTIRQYLTASNFPFAVSRANSLLYFTDGDMPGNQTPFLRNYLVINFEIGQENNQAPEVKPRCDVTYTSLDEVQKLGDPRIVCKLDLSKAGFRNIPKELYSFTNMQQLTLGSTAIPEAEISQLKQALPKCEITYQLQTKGGVQTQTPALPESGIVISVEDLNVRQSPAANAPVVAVVKKGATMRYVEKVYGENMNGNAVWLKNADGNYIWSGGVSLYTPTETEQELGFVGFNAYWSLDKESYTLMQDIASYLRQNSRSRIRLEAGDGYDIYMPRIEAAIKEFNINNAQIEKVNTGNTKQQQKQEQLNLQKPVRVVGINFPAGFNSNPRK